MARLRPPSRVVAMNTAAASSPSRPHRSARWLRLSIALVAAVGVLALAGCGSSKPGYCADRTSLQDSINGLTTAATSGGVSGLKSQIEKIQSDANAVVASAKSDFPTETTAIKSSVDALTSAVEALPAHPSSAQIATITTSAASVVSSVKTFVDATSSKCD